MTSLTSRTALFFYALILAPLAFINLSTIARERAEAKNPQKNAGLDNRKALQDQIDKTNSQTTQKDLSQALYLLTSRFNFKTSAPKSAPLNLAQFGTYIDSNKFKPFHSHFQT